MPRIHEKSPAHFARRSAAVSIGFAGALVLGAGLGLGVMTVPSGGAQAQGFFSFWDEPPQARKMRKARVPKADKDDVSEVAAPGERSVKGPLVLSVSLARQRVTVYDGSDVVAESPISSGRVGYATPTGVFSILEKKRMHFSNLYESAPMPNMQRITWSGVALHAGALPGYPASHGCIRLPYAFSKKLFGMTKSGARVIVSREPVEPVAIAHERLFAAYPPDSEMSTASISTRVADASHPQAGATTVSAVLGVTAAAAAETAAPVPLPRSPYRVHREAELGRITADIRTANYKKAAVSITLAQAAKASDAARGPYMAVRPSLDKLDTAARKAESARDAAQSEIAYIDERKASKRKLNPSAEHKLDEKRSSLDAKLPALIADAEAARAEWQQAADAAKPLETAMMQAESARRAAFAEYSRANAELSRALAEEDSIKRQDGKRAYPVSVFISRKTQRLYVRQGYEPILDVPVTIDRSNEVIGTHVFTALDYVPNKAEMSWSVVSVPTEPSSKPDSKKSKKDKTAKADATVAVPASRQTAAAALERIAISDDVRERIADVMKPGSSLIISDNGMSGETGEYTDFIVSLR